MAQYLRLRPGVVRESVKSQISTERPGSQNITAHYTLSIGCDFPVNLADELLFMSQSLTDPFNTQHLILKGVTISKQAYATYDDGANPVNVNVSSFLPILKLYEYLYIGFSNFPRTDLNNASTFMDVINGCTYYHPLQHKSFMTDIPFHKNINDDMFHSSSNNFVTIYLCSDGAGIYTPGTDLTNYLASLVALLNVFAGIPFEVTALEVTYGITIHFVSKNG